MHDRHEKVYTSVTQVGAEMNGHQKSCLACLNILFMKITLYMLLLLSAIMRLS